MSAVWTAHASGISLSHLSTEDLAQLSLEDLMNVTITSVSKKKEELSKAASAVYVISQEDIRRSGATSIPQVLQMVPGLEVARSRADSWMVTARGFNGTWANKLLVLIDGRTIYNSMSSGVYWQIQDIMLEDVERIEVIRGPGSTLWGANAVNGVINIITKYAGDTQGGLITAGGGDEERGFSAARYGGRIAGQDAFYRVYAKYLDRDSFVDRSGKSTGDGRRAFLSGFRMDWQSTQADSLTFQGDVYGDWIDEKYLSPSPFAPYSGVDAADDRSSGMNMLGRWSHTFSETSDMMLQIYYDRMRNMFHIEIPRVDSSQEEMANTFDLELQHRFLLGSRQEIVWGGGIRFISDHIDEVIHSAVDPESRDSFIFNAFLQDEITLVNDLVWLTLGTKIEHNDYTGFELQPSARLLWTPTRRQTVWGAISRAVRTPSRYERDCSHFLAGVIPPDNPGDLPVVISFLGSDDYASEDLLAYELGYRIMASPRLFFDLAAFYNQYDHLRTIESGTAHPEPEGAPEYIFFPLYTANLMNGETYGVELAVNWDVLNWWRLRLSYTYLEMRLALSKESEDTASLGAEGENPHNQIYLRSSMELPFHLELDLAGRYVDNLPTLSIHSYFEMDARLGWRPTSNLELSIVGHNLLHGTHKEFGGTTVSNDLDDVRVERSAYGKVTWRF